MKNVYLLLIISSAIATVILSCKHEPIVPNAADKALPAVCFQSEILPVFQSYCAKSGCHNNGSHQGGYKLNNFTNIVAKGIIAGDALSSSLYNSLFKTGTAKMPQICNPDVTEAQKTAIRIWINQGATNTINCAATCDTNAYKYKNDIEPILITYCNGCHGGCNPQAGIDLSTYQAVKDYITLDTYGFVGGITFNPDVTAMPYQAAKMSDCNITKIQKWIDGGYPNN
jgi:hypothetical protein